MSVVPYQGGKPPAYTAEWLLDPAEFADRIAATDFVPTQLRNNPAAITAAILFGAEVGLGPMQSLAKISVINGRPTLAAEAQRAMILRAGHDLWIEETTVTRCTVAGRRRDSEATSRITWTIDDAKRANLAGKTPWRLYPRQMLLARASAELARAVFPDAIGGLAASEEMEDDATFAEIGNGPEPPPPPSRRRRRANVEGARETGNVLPPPVEALPPEPYSLPSEPSSLPSEPSSLTPEPSSVIPPSETVPVGPERASFTPPASAPRPEQEVLDEIAREFGAVPNPEPQPPAPDPAAPMTDLQRKRMHATFRDRGILDRSARLAYSGAVIDRPLETSADLTAEEASRIIDHLAQYDEQDPTTWPRGGDEF